jgi:CRP-like cAMP-binding protein
LNGAPAEGLFFITSGKVRIFLPVRNQSIEIEEAGPGHCIGLPAVISDRDSKVSVIAKTAVKAVFILKEEIAAALRRNPQLYLVINPMLSEALSSAYKHIRSIRSSAQVGVLA